MKRKLQPLLFLLIGLCMICFIGACSFGNSTVNTHKHSFVFEKIGEKYLKSPADCTHSAVYYCSCSCGEIGTATFEYGDPLGHSFTNYVYNEDAVCEIDGTKTAKCDRCTATDTKTALHTALVHEFKNYVYNGDADCIHDGTKTAVCEICKKAEDTITATGTALKHSFIHYESNNDATCMADGTKTATCERCSETDTITDIGSKLNHSYGAPTYEWDGQSCTATRVCQHDNSHIETETVIGVYVKDTDATCTVCEKGHYKATFVSSAFFEQNTAANSVNHGDPLEHDFNNYLSDNNATCTQDGTKTSKCSRCDVKNTITDVGSKGHNYDIATYEWNGQNCTASRICQRDSSHVETETVVGVYIKDTDATCTVCEKGHYKATFSNSVFTEQNTAKDSVNYGNPLDHDFEWIVDKPASKTETGLKHEKCTRCEETRNNNTVIPVITCDHLSAQKVQGKLATCAENGTKDYWYCVDCQKYFSDPSCQIEITVNIEVWKVIEKTGHNYGTASYVWNGQTCTATRVCQNNIKHTETETVTGVYIKDTNATCLTCEKGHYKATFVNPAFAEQYTAKDSVNYGNPLGHSFTNYISNNNATCENDGTKTAKCDRCSETNTITDVGSKLPHTYSTEWSYDEDYHWHQAICEHNTEISDKETHKWDAGVITKDATENEDGIIIYTCAVCKSTKTEVIPKVIHVHTYSSDWSFDETYHWHASTCGHENEVSGKSEHSWGAGEIIVEYDEKGNIVRDDHATVYSEGVMTYKCSCGAVKEGVINKIDSFSVVFFDKDNNIVSERLYSLETVKKDIYVPKAEEYSDQHFMGWFENTSSLIFESYIFKDVKKGDAFYFTAKYERQFIVTFKDYNGEQFGEAIPVYESDPNVPKDKCPDLKGHTPEGYEASWDENDLKDIKTDKIIVPKYKIKTYTVTFKYQDGTIIDKQENIPHGSFAIEPNYKQYYLYESEKEMKLYEFKEWSAKFDEVTSDMEIVACYNDTQYEKPAIAVKINGNKVSLSIIMPNTDYLLYSVSLSMSWVVDEGGTCKVEFKKVNISNLDFGDGGEGDKQNCTVEDNKDEWLTFNNKTKTFDFVWGCGNGHSFPFAKEVIALSFSVNGSAVIESSIFQLNDSSYFVYGKSTDSIDQLTKETPLIWFYE